MSELTNIRDGRVNFRWQLLTTVSAITLFGLGAGAALAADEDSDRPTVWIELGGQLSRLDDSQEVFAPSLMDVRPSMFSPSQKFEKLPLYSVDETGTLSFQPDGSDWVLSASIRYGRSNSKREVHQQTDPKPFVYYGSSSGRPFTDIDDAAAQKFADTAVRNDESHMILDFQAGKDVGMGLWGRTGGVSVVGLGVRFAQFSTRSNIALKSDPDWHFSYQYRYGFKFPYYQPYHSNAAHLTATRSFRGVGPEISWNSQTPFAGNTKDGELSLDWGINGAVLFGRQKAKTHHQTTGSDSNGIRTVFYNPQHITYQAPTQPDHVRSRTVIVPNVGGFAGLSFHVQNFKISAGYRADLFFGAMGGGIDAAKSENVGFYGPFATISVGLGG